MNRVCLSCSDDAHLYGGESVFARCVYEPLSLAYLKGVTLCAHGK